MNEEVKGRCSWCNGVIMERSSHIISMVTPKTLYCGKSCADAADGYKQQVGWIRVEERLPEVGVGNHRCSGTVLVSYSIGDGRQRMTTGYYQLDTRAWFLDRPTMHEFVVTHFVVTHWQPLSEPPPIEQKQEVGQCGDCRYWGHTNEVASYKLCRLHSDYQRTDGWLHTDGPISTSFNFGCVAFAPKGEE